jgi:hypothetical protein
VYAKRMDNLAPEPGRGADNVQFATIDWESCSPVELARHLFDPVPDGLAEQFKRKVILWKGITTAPKDQFYRGTSTLSD